MGRGIGPKAHPFKEPEGPASAPDAPSSAQPNEGAATGTEPCPETVNETENIGDSPRGVIRLLLAGHFKGVADVRLRINFFDELSAAGFQDIRPAVTEKIASLAEDVNARLEEWQSSAALAEEQSAGVAEPLDAFNCAIDALVNDFLSDSGYSSETLVSSAASAFDALLSSLKSLLGLDSEETAADPSADTVEASIVEPDVVDAGSETETGSDAIMADSPEAASETIDPQVFLDQLAETFAAALQEVAEMSDPAAFLPPLSPAQGNGVAYEKFLAIYNELLGLGESADATAAETLDVLG